MKLTAAAFVVALAACTPPPTKTDHDDRQAQELAIVMSLGVQETSKLKAGQWVLYSVKTEGSTQSTSTRLATVAAESGTFWIENRTIGHSTPGARPRSVITKFQVDAAAKPLQLWVGEMGTSRPTMVYPGKDAKGNPIEPTRPDPGAGSAKVEISQEKVTLSSGRSFDCTRLTSKATYPDGRQTMLVTWCSEDVPYPLIYNGKSYGGVVKRTYGAHTLEFAAMGSDAVAEMALPLPEK